ncbi:hypothetical protein RNZ50_17750 [Paracoccaceae bacterium Fryx2]|nr:hypothetical protein [Paracoccaceae bacterium Fryx2]
MRAACILMICALAGCAGADPRPVSVRLSNDALVVGLSDGRTCRADPAPGSGRMEACGLDWQVLPEARPNPLRQAFAGLSAALGLAVTPMAKVVLSGAGGRRVFASPP